MLPIFPENFQSLFAIRNWSRLPTTVRSEDLKTRSLHYNDYFTKCLLTISKARVSLTIAETSRIWNNYCLNITKFKRQIQSLNLFHDIEFFSSYRAAENFLLKCLSFSFHSFFVLLENDFYFNLILEFFCCFHPSQQTFTIIIEEPQFLTLLLLELKMT